MLNMAAVVVVDHLAPPRHALAGHLFSAVVAAGLAVIRIPAQ